jgi:hypothetical protein
MNRSLSPEFRARWAFAACLLGGTLAACGGGGGGTTAVASATPSAPSPGAASPAPGPATSPASPSPSSSPAAAPTYAPAPAPAAPLAILGLPGCAPTGVSGAIDYQVGSGAASSDGTTYTELNQVPWENLKAGDSVRIFYRASGYKGKFAITTTGTSSAPIRVCGLRGPNNERPLIDGSGAVTRTTAAYRSRIVSDTSTASGAALLVQLETESVVLLKSNSADYTSFPQYIQLFGLNIVRGYSGYSFTDTSGTVRNYDSFGACVNVNRGQNLLIADNEISDCMQAIYTVSKDDYIGSDPNNTRFTVTRNIRIAGNYFWNHGVIGDDHEHTTYTESEGIVIEFNRYGPPRTGSGGNSIKDRSAGTVVRYNRIEEGAHSIDLVEAEDFPITALADPAYRSSYVYGNEIQKTGDSGSFIHYGGDHQGPDNPNCATATYGECLFRQGTLYFFNNSLYVTGTGAAIFQLATTKETAQVWNNVIYFADSVASGYRSLRGEQDVAAGYTPGGIVNLSVNWVSTGWADSDADHPVTGSLNGTASLITGSGIPFDLTTFVPTLSALVDAGVAGPAAASAYPVSYQLNSSFAGVARAVVGSAIDLGAVEKP